MSELSDYIKSVRKKLGLTQEEFANVVGVSFVTVNRWENDHVTPYPLALRVIRELEETGVPKERQELIFIEKEVNNLFYAVLSDEILYTIRKETKHQAWVARYSGTKRIVDKDRFRKSLFKRLKARSEKLI